MAWGRIKPEHGGAKQGKGFWGRKWEAKAASRRARRRAERQVIVEHRAHELDTRFDDGVEEVIDEFELMSMVRPNREDRGP